MACKTLKLLFLLMSSFATLQMAMSGDPNILSDFLLPANVSSVDGNFFTYTGMRDLVGQDKPAAFKILKASMKEFPALGGQSVSYAVLQFPDGTVNPPHIHPRSSELLFLTFGRLQVGFVDTANKLFTQTLYAGDFFVFPKGLVHYQYNNAGRFAMAISAFGSANAGTVSLPATLFNTSIDDDILAVSFKTSVSTIHALKSGLMS